MYTNIINTTLIIGKIKGIIWSAVFRRAITICIKFVEKKIDLLLGRETAQGKANAAADPLVVEAVGLPVSWY